MPLRDHFHGALRDDFEWESFHSAWANTVVRRLNAGQLPPHYRAAPHVRLGAFVEVDVATYEREQQAGAQSAVSGNGGVAVALWAPPRPAHTLTVDLPAQDVFEARVYDDRRRLVAAVEFVSPANKDRAEHRRAFVAKCAAYLEQNVSVVVVDIVTERRDNLHVALLEFLEQADAAPWPADQNLYAAAYRSAKVNDAWRLEVWPEPLALGRPLRTLPLWLASDLAVPLELEASYEETCNVLLIP
ncbi:MAG TPA: DUF4058 family protein [Gemmataceae bacterium]|nr:DUF4058 family protein [Gemmataceae bacterium]